MSPSRAGRPLALMLRGLVAALPLIPIVAGIVLPPDGGSASGAAMRLQSVARAPQVRPAAGIPAGSGALVAVVQREARAFDAPGGRSIGVIGTRTGYGSPQVLWVADLRPGWLGTISTLAGNGRLAWIPQRGVALFRNPWQIRVSIGARRLQVLHDGQPVASYEVAVGRPDAPTPTGRFAVTDKLATGDPGGPYGCCILALSALAPHAIQGWSGGLRVAIHSTPATGSIGQAVSHGCVRLTEAAGRWLMDRVPLATPTLISA